jgi:ribonuclease P protein component
MSSKLAFQSLSGSEEFKYVLSGKKLSTPLFTIYYKEKKNDDKVNSIMLAALLLKS